MIIYNTLDYKDVPSMIHTLNASLLTFNMTGV